MLKSIYTMSSCYISKKVNYKYINLLKSYNNYLDMYALCILTVFVCHSGHTNKNFMQTRKMTKGYISLTDTPVKLTL